MSTKPLLGPREAPAHFACTPSPALDDEFDARCTVTTLPPRPSLRRRLVEGAFWLGLPLVLGVVLGLALPGKQGCPSSVPRPVERLSAVIGWVYFCAWSVSFYPQAWLNWRRKSVAGLSLDFQLLNLLGFGCYSVYNAALYWAPAVRHEYSCTHGGAAPAVHANDVFFALHAFAVTSLTLVQCAIYDRGGQRVSRTAAVGVAAALAAIAAYLGAVVSAAVQQQRGGGGGAGNGLPSLGAALAAAFDWSGDGGGPAASCGELLSWLSFLYFLSYIKLGISLVKYIPQVYLNHRLRSTAGWNMHNVALDFSGGLLSLGQLVLDGAATGDWTAVTGNPVKFLLGFASMFFDLVFMAQHFCMYPPGAEGDAWPAAADLEAGPGPGPAGSKRKLPAEAADAGADAGAGAASGSGGARAVPLPLPAAGGELEPATPEQPLLRGA